MSRLINEGDRFIEDPSLSLQLVSCLLDLIFNQCGMPLQRNIYM